MSKIAAIGPDNLFGGFKVLGVDVFPADEPGEAGQFLSLIVKEKKHDIIFLFESCAVGLGDQIDSIHKQTSPCLVVLPALGAGVGGGVDRIRELVKKATGQDLA